LPQVQRSGRSCTVWLTPMQAAMYSRVSETSIAVVRKYKWRVKERLVARYRLAEGTCENFGAGHAGITPTVGVRWLARKRQLCGEVGRGDYPRAAISGMLPSGKGGARKLTGGWGWFGFGLAKHVWKKLAKSATRTRFWKLLGCRRRAGLGLAENARSTESGLEGQRRG
jgi:hypothetical protein